MKPRKKKPNVLWRTFFDVTEIETGLFKLKASLFKMIVSGFFLTLFLVVLQWCGALPWIAKAIMAAMR